LFAFGESQISESAYGTSSFLKDQLEIKYVSSKIDPSEENLKKIRRYKKSFDDVKNVFHDDIKRISGEEAVIIWAPVLRWMFKKLPNAYQLKNLSLSPYLGENVRADVYLSTLGKISKSHFLEQERLEKLNKETIDELGKRAQRIVISFLFILLLGSGLLSYILKDYAIATYFSQFIGLITVVVFLFLLRQKKQISKTLQKKVKMTRWNYNLEDIFPQHCSYSLEEVKQIKNLNSNNFYFTALRLDIFKEDEKDHLVHLQKMGSNGFDPILYQHRDCIGIMEKIFDYKFRYLVHKTDDPNPLEVYYFREDGNIVAAIMEKDLEENLIIKELMENIDWDTFDVPAIILEYLDEKDDTN
jgi:hypothetical protein